MALPKLKTFGRSVTFYDSNGLYVPKDMIEIDLQNRRYNYARVFRTRSDPL